MTAFIRRTLRRAVVALSLAAVLTLAFAPLLRAASLQRAQVSASEAAADLKATFGSAFVLCVNGDGDGSTPDSPHHDEQGCPLCCIHAAPLLAAPDATVLSARLYAAFEVLVPAEMSAEPPPARTSPVQPRAPPSI